MGSKVLDGLREAVGGIRIVDTHEHLVSEARRLAQPVDVFTLTADYVSADLVSAGMPVATLLRLADAERPLDERWRDFAPYWRSARTTGFGRAARLAARDLYGVDDIDERTYHELSERMAAANTPGWTEQVFRTRAGIDIAANQSIPELDPTPIEAMDRRLFVPVVCLDDYVTPMGVGDLERLEARSQLAIRCLDDLEAASDAAIDEARAAGAAAVKILLAYRRSLRFEPTARADAEAVFIRLRRYAGSWLPDVRTPAAISWAEAGPLQDYLVHRLVRRCAELRLPIQVHTGLQAGNGSELANAHPAALTNLFIEYPDARFDLFHAGYPFQGVAAVLGKTFPNVYVDLCWVHGISPITARLVLREWIDTVPASKILAFGGDSTVVEGTYAQARIARENVARALADAVEDGDLDHDEAPELARWLMRDNARAFLGLSDATDT